MSPSKKYLVLVALLGSLASCGGEDEPISPPLDASFDAPRGDVGQPETTDPACVYEDINAPPTLECSGLYSDWAKKTVAPG
ncbi:MAG: hypothetical protein ABW133_07320, partial [Polyangiaceae bacterium]